MFDPGDLQRRRGDEAGGDPHFGRRVRHRGRGRHHHRRRTVPFAHDIGTGEDRFGELGGVGHRESFAGRVQRNVFGEVRLVDEQHGDPHPVEVGDRRILRRVSERFELFDELGFAAFDDALGVTRQGAGVVVGGEVIEAALDTGPGGVGVQRDCLDRLVRADRRVEIAGRDPGGELA